MTNKTAILLGATGLTGSLLLTKLIADESYSSIKLFSRKKSGNPSTKIKEYIVDLLKLEDYKSDFTGDVVFCCIGTTKAKTKDQDRYKAIDYGIPYTASRLAKENNISTFVVVSAMGANKSSKIFYNRTKGEMEQAVLSQKIPNTYILRPSMILGNRNEYRIGESIGKAIMKVTNFLMVGNFRKYRGIQANTIANAMFALVGSNNNKEVFESDKIEELGK